ncbi:MAG: hypothetical protein LUH47_03515 [Clostridiales bacterium]|nr:hypothetical protein [Clostridiales bacterium]
MKKEYTKPNMEIVSFNLEENITTDGGTSGTITNAGVNQNTFTTISY